MFKLAVGDRIANRYLLLKIVRNTNAELVGHPVSSRRGLTLPFNNQIYFVATGGAFGKSPIRPVTLPIEIIDSVFF
jgi:hypothetical protein